MQDIEQIRRDFIFLQGGPEGGKAVFLDNAATTLKPKVVREAVCDYYDNYSANALRGDYERSHAVDKKLAETRQKIAEFIGAEQPERIVYTAGATAALNLAAFGYGKRHLKAGDIILTTAAEHSSCLLPWLRLAGETGAVVKEIPLAEDGSLTLSAVRQCLGPQVKFLVLAHVGNVLGDIRPIREICELAHRYESVVIVDAAQSAPCLPINVREMDCDFLAFSAHKLCGPSGIGILYGKTELLKKTEPLLWGGGSNVSYSWDGEIQLKKAPYKLESGTLNLEGIWGMAAAIDYLRTIGMEEIHSYVLKLREYAAAALAEMEHIRLYNRRSASGIIAFNVKAIFAEDVAGYFNSLGICVRTGEHCAKLLPPKLNALSTIRASIYFYNNKEDIDTFLAACRDATKENCYRRIFAKKT